MSDMPPDPPRTRRSQEERRREMRARLAEATLDSLAANGYHGAGLADILARAGVSRGAWAHHYASKKELVAQAAAEMLGRSTRAAGGVAERAAGAPDRLAALLDAVWHSFYQGRHRDVLFEVALACRTDAELRTALAPVFRDFLAAVAGAWRVTLRPRPGSGVDLGDVMILTIYLLRGMALQELASGETDDHARLRALWARLMGGLVEVASDP